MSLCLPRLGAPSHRLPRLSPAILKNAWRGALLLGMGALSSGAARAATYTVTNTFDDFRTGSLRTAINSANSTLADDDIVFAASGTGTIIVSNSAGGSPAGFTINSASTAGKLTISNTQTNGVTLSGNNANQIFVLSPGANLSLTRLTISGGKSSSSSTGGAISVGSGATLGINNCTLSGNTLATGGSGGIGGGAIYNNGTLSIAGSTFSGNTVTSSGSSGSGGGAIFNSPAGNLSISNSSFASNTSAFSGGAIGSSGSTNSTTGVVSFGTISITGSTFSGNSATGSGGAISSLGTLTTTNSTFSGNSATGSGGAIFQNAPTQTAAGQKRPVLNVSSTTIAGNMAGPAGSGGGGIFNRATLNLFNSIVAGNTGGTTPNISNSTTGNPPAVFNDGGNNITTGDPLLDALADNGGPTLTRAPQTGSPALNTGLTTLPTDQRGVPRPQGSAPDIGAVEVAGPFVVTSLADNTTADGVTTLREAMTSANATMTAETITFAVSGTLTLTSLLPTINNVNVGGALTISNPQSAGVTISGANTFRIFTSSAGANLTLNRLTISGGNGTGSNGGAIANLNAALTITNCTFSGNTTGTAGGGSTAGSGGAISNTSTTTTAASTVTVSNSTFASNTAANAGAIFNSGGTLNLTNCTVSLNSATASGGAGAISNSNNYFFNLNNSIVAGNTTNVSGGGQPNISNSVSGSRNLTNVTVSNGTGNINSNTPNLGPLADNGGPTFTFLPLSNSAAINAGNGTGPDQRGITRPQGSAPDIGAVEVIPPNVAPVNTLPVAQSAAEDTLIILSQDAGTLISIADADAGNGILSVELRPVNGRISFNTAAATNPSDLSGVTLEGNVVKLLRGTVTNLNLALRNLTFTPIRDFVGLATLQVTTNDNGNTGLGGAKTDSDTLNITFNEGNDPPVALNDNYATSQDSTLTVSAAGGVLKNDSDPDSPRSTLSAVLDTAPANAASGGFTLNADGSFTYTPAMGFFGSDMFTYHVSDGSLSSAIARVRISVAQTEATILDVSTQVDVTRLGVRYDFSLAAYTQEIVLTNNGANISNPIYLVLDNLQGATLTNKTGNIQNFDTSGSPYILVANSLGAGASTSIVLQFDNSTVSFDTRVLTGTTTP